jgi:hypothetical protein
MNGDDSRKLPVSEPCRLCVPSRSNRWAAFDWRRLSHRMLRLSDAPKFVMHEMEGCFESLMYLGLLRGRQNSGGGKSLKSTLRFSMAPSVAPVKAVRVSLALHKDYTKTITNEPVGGDISFSLHMNNSSLLCNVAAQLIELVLALRRDVNLQRFTAGFHSRRSVHCRKSQSAI